MRQPPYIRTSINFYWESQTDWQYMIKGWQSTLGAQRRTLLNYIVVDRAMAPKHVHIIIPRTCESYEYITLESKMLLHKAADAIEVANPLTLRWGYCPGLPDGPKVITWVLKSEKRRGKGEGEWGIITWKGCNVPLLALNMEEGAMGQGR